ncbi:NAD(P)/FAD-dependent oxidoreductase [Kiloniella antarctica]|uniref:NAD(P)/FAD-dependent oxidoreductase n=1 Tax=Kiloniella antarctica TaxID=1550907 RepID=A0ABW5BIF5_9PROT
MKYLYDSTAFAPSTVAASYWRNTASAIDDFTELSSDDHCDIAIIGSGYTGMMTAYHLATRYGMDVKIIEAAQPGWGASGRNGGFCCMGAAKLSYQQMIKRYGLEEAKSFVNTQKASVSFVKSFLTDHNIDADVTGEGEVSLAHRANRIKELQEEKSFMKATFDHDTTLLTPNDLSTMGLAGNFHGGLHNPTGFGLHPLKYARGLAEILRKASITIFGNSPVLEWSRQGNKHLLRSEKGTLKAKQVVMATNGYTPDDLSESASGKLLPALSSVLVTRPLTDQERSQQGWTNTTPVYDTRILLHYFRLLPDGRFLFGGRGGTDASPTGKTRAEKTLRHDFEKLFPKWAPINHTHFWQGFVCLANNLVPYVGPINKDRTAWASLAYHGNGVAMSSWAGQALADEIAGKDKKSKLTTVLSRPYTNFPLPSLRLLYLKAAYNYYHVKDEWF